jgi:hypothetical protein
MVFYLFLRSVQFGQNFFCFGFAYFALNSYFYESVEFGNSSTHLVVDSVIFVVLNKIAKIKKDVVSVYRFRWP